MSLLDKSLMSLLLFWSTMAVTLNFYATAAPVGDRGRSALYSELLCLTLSLNPFELIVFQCVILFFFCLSKPGTQTFVGWCGSFILCSRIQV